MIYKEYIFDKKVILVCPSNILIDSKLGIWIDSFDVVIRINNFFNTIKFNIKDCGKRCDVLYINNQFAREFSPFPLENWKSKGLKWLCYKKVLNEVDKNINNRIFGHVAKELNTVYGALTGTLAVKDILNQRPKTLYVSGMNFYSSPENNSHYIEGYAPGRDAEYENRIHNVESNKSYIIRLYKNKKIKLCELTKKVLNIKI